MVTKPITDVTVTLDSWPDDPVATSGYGVTYSLIRSTNPSSDFTYTVNSSNAPFFKLPIPKGNDKLYYYRIKAIYKKE